MREAIYHTCLNLSNGGKYVIGDKKYQQEKELWKVIETTDYRKKKAEPEDEASILKKIQEFTNTDVDIGFKSADEYEYFELLAEVKRLGVDVTGQPKRDVLNELYKEAIG